MTSVLPGPGERASIVRGVLAALPAGCWWVPGPREAPLATLRGVAPERVDPGAGAPSYKVAPASHAPALRALVGVGLALGSERPVVVQLGQGAVADGALMEALSLGASQEAPVIWVVATRDLTGAPVPAQGPALRALAAAAGVAHVTVDGDDAEAVQRAVARAVEAELPVVIEATLGHGPKESQA